VKRMKENRGATKPSTVDRWLVAALAAIPPLLSLWWSDRVSGQGKIR
jgi:hypothetical protein